MTGIGTQIWKLDRDRDIDRDNGQGEGNCTGIGTQIRREGGGDAD